METKADDKTADKPGKDKPAGKDDVKDTVKDDKAAAKDDKAAAKDDKAAAEDKPAAKPADKSTPKPTASKAAKPAAKPAGKGATTKLTQIEAKARQPEPPDLWDKAWDWIFAHGALPALAIITIGVGFVFRHLFAGEPRGDDLTFHMAEAARISDCLRAGDFDLWNPSANAGYASAYYYQVIPQLTSAVPAAIFGHTVFLGRHLDLLFWFQLSNWLPLVLAPAAAYRGMRMMGASPWQSTIAAFVVAFMNGESRWGAGAAGSFHVGLYTQTWSLTAFPLALGYAARWISKGEKLAPAVAWGAFVGLCHPFGVVSLGVALVIGTAAQGVLAVTDQGFISLGRSLEPVAPKKKPMEFGPRVLHDLATRWKSLPGFDRIDRGWPAVRLAILGTLMLVAFMPIWLPLLIDYSGFGGFPHRVGDEIGPGFTELSKWFWNGKVLDFMASGSRAPILTILLVVIVFIARTKFMRWLIAPALIYLLALGLGPHLGTTQDDLLPMVRFLGAMQTCMALAIGAGMVGIGVYLWKLFDDVGGAYIARTVMIAVGACLIAVVSYQGGDALQQLIRVMGDTNQNQHRDEMVQIADFLETQPPGRKQVAAGAENHWWNLLTYVYGRTPALLQMGGGGLQASPNYDYLWTGRDLTKNAWLYAAPYLVFARQAESKMPPGDTILHHARPPRRVRRPEPVLAQGPRHRGRRQLRGPPAADAGAHGDHRRQGSERPRHHLAGPGHRRVAARPAQGRARSRGRAGVAQDRRADRRSRAGVQRLRQRRATPPDGRTIKSWRQMSPGDDPDIVADVEVNQRTTTFLVRESWHPRWHAFVDGEEVPVRRMTPDFPAVDVPPGKHEVTLRFERPWWAWASWLVWPATAVAAWLIARWLNRRFPTSRAAADSM